MTQDTLRPIRSRLASLRARARALLLWERCGRGLAILAGAALLIGLIDYAVRFPPAVRWVFWLALLAGLVAVLWRWVLPAARFRPSLTEMALRVERTGSAQEAGLRGLLASGVEFADADQDTELSRGLAGGVVREARAVFARTRVRDLFELRAVRRATVMFVVVVGLIGAISVAKPALASIGASRVLSPWSGAQWPKRTMVVDAGSVEVHPLGQAFPLRAALTRTNRAQSETRVWARYRVDGSEWRRLPMTGQGRQIETAGGAGELYERLVEPGSFAADDSRTEVTLEYSFETEDDSTGTRRVLLVEPPRVVSAESTVTPPDYAETGAASSLARGDFEMGAGDDTRAVVAPVLSGSQVRFEIELNKPVPTEASDAWLAGALGLETLPAPMERSFESERWSLAWIADGSVDLRMRLTDEHGMANTDDASFGFEVVPDTPPSAAVLEPARDESVLATAVLDLVAEGRDDVGVAWVALERTTAAPPEGSEGAPAEAVGDAVEIARTDSGGTKASVTAALDLSGLVLHPGDEVWITGVAKDIYAFGGDEHDPTRSAPRVLRIIDDQKLIEQMRGELVGVRRNAMRLDEDQSDLSRLVQRGVVGDEAHRRQARISAGVEAQLGIVEQLAERAERNRLDDRALGDMLQDTGDALQRAGEASGSAEDELGKLAEQGATEPGAEQSESIEQDQQRVREELARVVEMLDRGEDGWVVRREIEQLAQEQRELMDQTAAAGAETRGQSLEQLTPEQRRELERIADKQLELAERAEQAIDELTDRARQLEEHDAGLSEAMAEAARRARESQVAQQMNQAGEQAEQNQTGEAGRSQQAALEGLEEVLEELENTERRRDEQLRRQLAEALEVLEELIRQQRAELAALDRAEQSGAYAGLDAGMIQLHTNTLGLIDTLEASGDLAPVAEPVTAAADEQSSAIIELRNDTIDPAVVREHEGESLRLLLEAKNKAEELQKEAEERENARRRAELRKAYRELLEEQIVLRTDTAMFDVDRRLTRRERADLRSLGERQLTLKERLRDLHEANPELQENGIFDFAHTRLDRVTQRAGDSLRAGGPVPGAVRDQGSAIALLQGLVEALRDGSPDDSEFSAQSGSGGASGGQPPDQLLPDIAQLIMLRAMQTEARDMTRLAEDGEIVGEELEEIGTLQRDLADRAREVIESMGEQPNLDEMVPEPGEKILDLDDLLDGVPIEDFVDEIKPEQSPVPVPEEEDGP